MLQAFIITLREGVEAALIVGITLAYLAKIGRPELRKAVYAALVSAFLGSIGGAILLSRTHFNEDVFGDCADSFRGVAEFQRTGQFSRHPTGSRRRRDVWRDVRKRQRAH